MRSMERQVPNCPDLAFKKPLHKALARDLGTSQQCPGTPDRDACSPENLHADVHNDGARNKPCPQQTEGSTGGGLFGQWNVRYSALKMDEALTPATTYLIREDMMLKEGSQLKRTCVVWFHLDETSRKGNL